MSNRNGIWWRATIVLASAAVFAKCLGQTALVIRCCDADASMTDVYGLDLLTLGWVGVIGSPLHPPLFVSVMAAWACACAEKRLATMIWAVAAVAVMAAYVFVGFSNAGNVAWLANPIIVATWFFCLGDKRRAGLISALFALGLTTTFLSVTEVPIDQNLEPADIISYGTGYRLWIVSAAILAAGMIADMLLFRASPQAPPVQASPAVPAAPPIAQPGDGSQPALRSS